MSLKDRSSWHRASTVTRRWGKPLNIPLRELRRQSAEDAAKHALELDNESQILESCIWASANLARILTQQGKQGEALRLLAAQRRESECTSIKPVAAMAEFTAAKSL